MSALEIEQVKIRGSQCSEADWVLEGCEETFRSQNDTPDTSTIFKNKNTSCLHSICIEGNFVDISSLPVFYFVVVRVILTLIQMLRSNFPLIATTFTNLYSVISERKSAFIIIICREIARTLHFLLVLSPLLIISVKCLMQHQ